MNEKINLGAGRVFMRNSAGGVKEVGYLRNITLDYSATEKEFRGSNTFPEDVGLVNEKLTGKATYGGFNGAIIAEIMGATEASGQTVMASEAKTAAASITVDQAATFVKNLGVRDASNNEMTKVAAAPAVGQYSVNEATGVYTFNVGETGTLTINYSYTIVDGKTMTFSGRAVGSSPKFEVHVYETARDGSKFGYLLYAVTFSKINFALQSEDFTESNLEFSCTRHATSGKVFDQWRG